MPERNPATDDPQSEEYKLRHNFMARDARRRTRADATVVHDEKTAAGLGYPDVDHFWGAIRKAKSRRRSR